MCSKKKFSKIEAITCLNKDTRERRRSFRREKRVYYCETCNCWHLTSQDDREETEEFDLTFKTKWNNLLNIK